MKLPTIHTNGTSAQCLTEGYAEARSSVAVAIEQLAKVEFNSRDYYPQGPAAWACALSQREQLFAKLRSVASELYEHEEHCARFIK